MLRFLFPELFEAMAHGEKITYPEFRNKLCGLAKDCGIGKAIKPVLAANLIAFIVAAALFLGRVSADFFTMGTQLSYTDYFKQTCLTLADDVAGSLALAFLLLGVCVYLWDYFKQKSLSLMALRKNLPREVCEDYHITIEDKEDAEFGQLKARMANVIVQLVTAGLAIAALLILCLQQRGIAAIVSLSILIAICFIHIWSLIPSENSSLRNDRCKIILWCVIALVSAALLVVAFCVFKWCAPNVSFDGIAPVVSSVVLILVFVEIYWFLLVGVHFGYVFLISQHRKRVVKKTAINEEKSQNPKRRRTFEGWLRRTVAIGFVTVLILIPLLILLTIATFSLLCALVAFFYCILSSLFTCFPIVYLT